MTFVKLPERSKAAGDQLAQEHLLVGVEGVDDQRQELVDISREGVAFRFGAHGD